MIKQIILLLKKEIRLISLWFMSFLRENYSWTIQKLMYVMTLGCSLSSVNYLEKVICKGWFGALTMISPSSYFELEIVWMIGQGGSWIKITSKFLLFSKIMSVRSLFFQTFCENIFRFFIIIYLPHPQLSG